MLIVRYKGLYISEAIKAKYVLCGESEITLFDNNEHEIISLPYDILISIVAE